MQFLPTRYAGLSPYMSLFTGALGQVPRDGLQRVELVQLLHHVAVVHGEAVLGIRTHDFDAVSGLWVLDQAHD